MRLQNFRIDVTKVEGKTTKKIDLALWSREQFTLYPDK